MRVLVNATDGVLSVRAVRRYVTEMITGLGRHPDVDLHVVFFTHHGLQVRQYLKSLPRDVEPTVHWVPVPRRIAHARHRRPRLELRRLAREVDLYHETTIDSPDFDGLPVVATIHGVCPLVAASLLDPSFVEDKRRAYERTVALSDYFAPVSETTRREFLEVFPMDRDRVRAIPLGVSESFRPRDRDTLAPELHALSLQAPYLLYVGGIQPNKNIPRVLRTFARLRRERIFEGRLVLAGDLHYSEEDFETLLEVEGVASEVDLPGFFDPSDPHLAAIYAGASLFLFPSLYEGWTSPPLEAMASGVPVIASDTSSIPETVGDAAILCDPHDENAWVLAATRILSDRAHAERLGRRGIEHSGQYPWSRTVDATVEFYRAILDGTLVGAPDRELTLDH
ncbi:MAG: glycosyltransferase family 4 protein [Planctomycetes bacterium]|nr:glycosyltransferase family 4 protein [Planctomycetota bacterium]